MRRCSPFADYSTGIAFIVFQYEADKIKFMRIVREAAARPWLARTLRAGSVAPASEEGNVVLPRSSREAVPTVTQAPEPSEVNWEALELNDTRQFWMTVINWVLVAMMLCVSLASIISLRIWKQLRLDGINKVKVLLREQRSFYGSGVVLSRHLRLHMVEVLLCFNWMEALERHMAVW